MSTVLERPGAALVEAPRPAAPAGPPVAAADAPEPKRHRRDIQGLRAVAVLLVVLYHAHVPGIRAGYVGVDAFFVISGFLITGHLMGETERHGRPRLLAFYARRMRRLLPAAALVAIATMVAARLWLPPLQVKALGVDSLFTAIYGMNIHLAVQGVDYQEVAGAASPFQHFWSLAVEEQFYAVWPLLVVLCCAVGARLRRGLVAVVLVAAVVASFLLAREATGDSSTWAYFAPHTRAWELGAGALVALLGVGLLRRLPSRTAAGLTWAGLAMLIGSAFLYTDDTAFPSTAALLPVVGTALVIAAGTADPAGGARALLGRRPLQGIGNVSYSWYLWHWPMLLIVPAIAGYEFGWVRNLEVLVLSLWLAVLAYYVVESPGLRSRLRKSSWLAIGTTLSGAIALTGVLVVATLPALVGSGTARSYASSKVAADGAYVARVQRQVAASVTTVAAPRNLRPVLATAKDDRASDHGQHCLAGFAAVKQGACVYGDPKGSKTMVLIGDSHAHQWLPAYAEAGRREHWKVISWTKSACPVAALSLRNPQLGRAYTECDAWRSDLLAKIIRMKPDRVVVGQSDSVIGKAFTDEQWADRTVATLQRLKRAGIPSTYMLDIPYPAGDVPQCVSKNLDDVQSCNRDPKTLSWVANRHTVLHRRLGLAGIPSVEPRGWMCTKVKCPVIIGNVLVYRDASHITASYSSWLAPLVQPVLAGKGAAVRAS